MLLSTDAKETKGKPNPDSSSKKIPGPNAKNPAEPSGNPQNDETGAVASRVWGEDNWLFRADSLKEDINEVKGELDFYAEKLVYDIADEWNDKILDFLTRLSNLREDYRTLITSHDKEFWQITLKNMILEEANFSKNFASFIETRFWELLGLKDMKIESVADHECLFALKLTKNRDIMKVKYTGCLVDGLFEGRGILKHASNDEVFYEGKFRTGDIFGSIYDLFYKKDSKMLEVKCVDDYLLSKANGPIQFYHTNGQLALRGTIKNGLIDGPGVEHHMNGKLRYEGLFKEGGYDGRSLEVYHNYPVASADKTLMVRGTFEKGKLQGNADRVYLRENIAPSGNTYAILENAFYVDNLLNTKDGIKPDIKQRNPVFDLFYEGQYKDGLKHGNGKVKCAASGIELFNGEWKNGLPYRNTDSQLQNRVTIYHRIFGKKIFQGTIAKRPDGKIGGKCKLYYYLNGEDCFYDGSYAAPSLSSVLLCTWDLELEGFRDFVPAF